MMEQMGEASCGQVVRDLPLSGSNSPYFMQKLLMEQSVPGVKCFPTVFYGHYLLFKDE